MPSTELPAAAAAAAPARSVQKRSLCHIKSLGYLVLVAVCAFFLLGKLEGNPFFQRPDSTSGNLIESAKPATKQAHKAGVSTAGSFKPSSRPADPEPFYTRYTSSKWLDYYSPFGKNK